MYLLAQVELTGLGMDEVEEVEERKESNMAPTFVTWTSVQMWFHSLRKKKHREG